jgi:N-methylhydantoinase A
VRRTTRIGVDVGGTFTDLVLHDDERGLTWTGKRPTTIEDPSRGIVEGITRLLADTDTDIDQVQGIVHGTTLITNAVLERTGATVGLITTDGFRDILEMGREIRYDVANLYARPAPVIVPRHLRHGVPGRLRADGTQHTPLDEEAIVKVARSLVDESGAETLVIAFLNSHTNPAHERRARDLLHYQFPDLLITLSAEVAPEIGEYERSNTACLNAYVQPLVHRYLDQLDRELKRTGFTGQLSIMQSSGGLTTVEQAKAFPVHLLESGPAAGATAAAFLAALCGERNIISFDMGGTTAKMCLIEDGQPRLTHEFEAGRLDRFKPGSGLPVKLAVIDMIEIGAGGGSIAAVDDLGLLKVGPRSAGSVPGPVAYGRGGDQPTVTDADLLAGYLDPDHFLGGEMNLSVPQVQRAIDELSTRLGSDPATTAAGIEDLVTENMAAATRTHLAEKGRDPRAYTLMAFGGAGPVHAYALAHRLKIPRIIVPLGAGVMSALGLLVAAPSVQDVRSYPTALTRADWDRIAALYQEMETQARSQLLQPSDSPDDVVIRRSADMRYLGQGFEITVPLPEGHLSAAHEVLIRETFAHSYRAVFGRTIRDGTPELINWRLSASLPASPFTLAYHPAGSPRRGGRRPVHFGDQGTFQVDVYDRYALPPGSTIHGPALFEERETSCAVGPDCTVTVDPHHNLIIEIQPDHATAAHSRRRHIRTGRQHAMTATTTDQIDALAAWDTPALSNALDALRLRPFNTGYSDGSLHRITGGAVMVGRAVTARMVARDTGENGIPVARLHKAINDMDGPVVVVIEDRDQPAGAGAFLGEVNGSLLAALNIRGLVTNGRVRDIAELRRLPYPVYAAGLCVARSYMRLTEVGVPVTVAGMRVETGDILHGDEHGVLQIPPPALAGLIATAELIREDEQKVINWSKSADFSVPKLLELRRVRH